jgi:MOSC domain-containing protein YiiM
MAAVLASINVSRGGIPKESVFEVLVTTEGVDGDHHRDRRYHGGPDRAVVLYSLEVIKALQGEGHSIAVGAAGENLTLSGLPWATLEPGQQLEVGPVQLAITRYTRPCSNIAHLFVGNDFTRVSQKTYPGWSRLCARVLVEGIVRIGDPVRVL